MAHKFERCRMEPQEDGSVNIGITIIATIGQSDDPDPDFHGSAQWARCLEAHAHDWDTCNIRALFGARAKDAQNNDIVGSSKREQLIAWLQEQRRVKGLAIPKEIPLPTRKVQKVVDGKDVEVDEAIKDVSLT